MYIQTRDKKLKDFLFGGEYPKWYPIECARQLAWRLQLLKSAQTLNDLRTPPGNRLERLSGNLKGYWSIRVNRQYRRLIFRWDAVEKEACDVYFDDYHR